jgi:hypothetical protein
MGAVFDLDMPRVPKFILLAMADPAADDGTNSYLAVETISKKTSTSTRGVQQNIHALAGAHFLEFVGKIHYKTRRRVPALLMPRDERGAPHYGHGFTAEYRLTIDKGDKKLLLELLQAEKKPAGPAPFPEKNPAARDSQKVQPATKNPAGAAGESNSLFKDGIGSSSRAGCQDTKSAPSESVEKTERQFNGDLTKAAKNQTASRANGRPTEPLRAELYDGIFRKKIENAFFDSQREPFEQQIETCVEEAVTSLMLNRTGKMMHLRDADIVKLALQKLSAGIETLKHVKDFSQRRAMVANAIARTVADAAAELLGRDGGGGMKPSALKATP